VDPVPGARRSPAIRASLVLLTLAALALRLAYLSQPMRFDESACYVLLASRSLRTCLTVFLHNNNHPLHTLLVHFSTRLLGNHPWAVRTPTLLAGVLLVPATFWTFEAVFDETSALLAAALVVGSAPLIEYSTNARGYNLQALLVVLMLGATARVLKEPTTRGWAAFALWSVLGFYTIPTTLYFFLAMLVFMLGSLALGDAPHPPRRFLTSLGVTCAAVTAIVVLLYLPFILHSGLATLTANGLDAAFPWGKLREGIGETFQACAASWHAGLPSIVVAALVAGFVVSLLTSRSFSQYRLSPAIVTLATCLAMMLLQRILPPQRVFLPLLPLYLGSCAAGLRWMGGRVAALARNHAGPLLRGRAGAAIVAAAMLVAAGPGALVVGSGAAYQTHDDQVIFSDAEGVALALKEVLQKGDLVYVQPTAGMILRYYLSLHDVPPEYLYVAGSGTQATGHAFVVDASRDEPEFSYREALKHSNLSPSEQYVLAPILELPRATLFGLRDTGQSP
jgi:hypothetical protein